MKANKGSSRAEKTCFRESWYAVAEATKTDGKHVLFANDTRKIYHYLEKTTLNPFLLWVQKWTLGELKP